MKYFFSDNNINVTFAKCIHQQGPKNLAVIYFSKKLNYPKYLQVAIGKNPFRILDIKTKPKNMQHICYIFVSKDAINTFLKP